MVKLEEHRKISKTILLSDIKKTIIKNISNIDLTDYTLDYYNYNLVSLYTEILNEIGLENIQIVGEEISDGKYNLYFINLDNNLDSEMLTTVWSSCNTIICDIERVIKELGYTITIHRKVV